MKLSVLMPVFDEARTLRTIVKRVLDSPIGAEIELICVDDYSSDDSLEILRDLAEAEERIKVVAQPRNMGKGMAIRTAIEHMTGEVAIVQDADLEYDPSEYPRLLQPIVERKADVVYGSRFLGDQPHRVLYFWHYVGNRLLTTLSNCFTNLNLTDMETCYKVFRREVIESVAPTLQQNRFGFEPEVTAKIARRGYAVYEMSVSYSGRTYEQGKKINWRDGMRALWCIVRYGIMD